MKIFSFFFIFMIIATSSHGEEWQSSFLLDHPMVGKIYDSSANEITKDELLLRLRTHKTILIGEKHDNPDHHRIEKYLLHELVDSDTTVVFEMLDSRQDEYLHHISSKVNLQQLQTILQWPENSWNWNDYGPLFLQTIKSGGIVQTGNIGPTTVMNIYKNGLDQLMEEPHLSSIKNVQDTLQVPLADLVYFSHCEKVAREKLQPMVNVQLARDASMAYSLISSPSKRNILISGGVHANKEIGVPQHLATSSTTILLREVSDSVVIPQASSEADYIWYTPQFSDEDYCEKFNK